jgi:hypothetical protein
MSELAKIRVPELYSEFNAPTANKIAYPAAKTIAMNFWMGSVLFTLIIVRILGSSTVQRVISSWKLH